MFLFVNLSVTHEGKLAALSPTTTITEVKQIKVVFPSTQTGRKGYDLIQNLR